MEKIGRKTLKKEEGKKKSWEMLVWWEKTYSK